MTAYWDEYTRALLAGDGCFGFRDCRHAGVTP